MLRIAVLQRLMRRRERDLARIQVRGRRPVVRELDRSERAVRVHLLAHQRQRGNVVVVPQPRFDVRRDVARRMDLALLGADDGPAAFGFHRAHRRVRFRHGVTHAVAVRDLEEAVLRRDRTDADGLEQDVVARIALHEKRQDQVATAAFAARRRCHFIRKYSGRPSANSPMPHQNASGPAPHSVHSRVESPRASPRRSATTAVALARPGRRATRACKAASEQNRYITRYAHVEIRMIIVNTATIERAVVHQHHDRDQRAGDEQRVVRRAVARFVCEQLREHLLLRQHARHLALNQDPAVERAEAADECEQREQRSRPSRPRTGASTSANGAFESCELRAGDQQDHRRARDDVDDRGDDRAPQRRARNVALRVDDVAPPAPSRIRARAAPTASGSRRPSSRRS